MTIKLQILAYLIDHNNLNKTIMKKSLLLCLTLCISLLANAQATDLVVDCQTPGWLSSKINYGDQQTVKNLKVTGYINNDDLKFIGLLVNNQRLDGTVDLSECSIVKSGTGGVDNGFSGLLLEKKDTIKCLRIPKSASSVSGCTHLLHCDTLYFDCKMKYINRMCLDDGLTEIDYLFLGEEVDSIPGRTLFNISLQSNDYRGLEDIRGLKNVYFSSKIRYIGDCSFMSTNLEYVNFEDLHMLEYIGEFAFSNMWFDNKDWNFRPDTLWIDSKYFNSCAFGYKEGQHIYIGERCEEIGSGKDLKFTYGFGDNIIIHMESSMPPEGNCPKTGTTVYVPKGAKDNYLNSQWKYSNIIELNPIEAIVLSEHHVLMNIGESYSLSANVVPIDADDIRITWNSANQNIAIVDDDGGVSAIESGQTYVYATSVATGIKDSCLIVVRKNVTGVTFEKPEVEIKNIGDSLQLIPTVKPEDATDKSVTWKSANESICTVSSTGMVTAVGIGSTLVTVTTVDGGYTANCIVKVLQHVNSVALNKPTLSLKVGESDRLQAFVSPDNADDKCVSWSSSNEQIASVDASGNVKALKAGEAWIKAVSIDNAGAKDSCKITVTQPVTGITLSPEKYTMNSIGEKLELVATVLPEDASNKSVMWKSTNESVCFANNGIAIATGYGTAIVIATTVDGGYTAFCTIEVKEESGIQDVKIKDSTPIYDMMGRKVSAVFISTKAKRYY